MWQQRDAGELLDSLQHDPVERLRCPTDVPFFQRQQKIVLENSGAIDPERIEEYIAALGYRALVHSLTEMTPVEVTAEVIKSGLRGRGGAGYPTGLKWSTVSKAVGTQKFVICNADEGDPGAFMDRSVLESDPHRVLEGMPIAAYAVGASAGYIYVRAEYPLGHQAPEDRHPPGRKTWSSGREHLWHALQFPDRVAPGSGSFCLRRRDRADCLDRRKSRNTSPATAIPGEEGLFGQPTLINNVETFANIAPIIRNGGDWYAGIGTEKSKGTKVFALAGRVQNTGLVEVPMGITLREIVFDIGGGIPDGKKFKAVQTGGPSGGCLPAECLDMPVDYESLASAGSIMGSGGMIVMDETSCMVDVAKYFMDFCMTESCGKCIPCRVGTYQMHRLLDTITELKRHCQGCRTSGGVVRSGQKHQSVRAGSVRAQPGAEHAALFFRRVQGTHRA